MTSQLTSLLIHQLTTDRITHAAEMRHANAPQIRARFGVRHRLRSQTRSRRFGRRYATAFAVATLALLVLASAASAAVQATFYQNASYGGAQLTLRTSVSNLGGLTFNCNFFTCENWNDKFSSMKVADADVTLFEHDIFRGQKYFVGPGGHVPNLGWFNDAATSVRVENVHQPTLTLSGPSGPTRQTDAEIRFSADAVTTQEGARYTCVVDGREFGCTSPIHVGGSANTVHNVAVTVTDPWGHTDRKTLSWTVDQTGPTVAIVAGPSGPTSSRTAAFTIDPGDAARTECVLGGGSWRPCDALNRQTYTDLPDGDHVFRVRGFDALENRGPEATGAWSVDATPPPLRLISGPTADPGTADRNPTFEFDAGGAPMIRCSLDDAAWQPCSTHHSQRYHDVADGQHTFRVLARDELGNEQVARRDFRVDTLAPDTAIVSGPSEGSRTSDQAAVFQFSSEPGVRFQCELDGGPFGPCPGGEAGTARLPDLPVGNRTLRVRAIDRVGNVEADPASRRWTILADADHDNHYPPQDCDDANPAMHPGAFDVPGNGIAEDCDGKDATYPVVDADVRAVWRVFRRNATLLKLRALRVPAGATVTVRCQGKRRSCPFRVRRRTLNGARSSLSVIGRLRGRRLPARTLIAVEISKPNSRGVSVSFVIRRGRVPLRRDRCLGATPTDRC